MVSAAELASFGVPTLDIPDAGHNVHVERPWAFAQAVVDFATAQRPQLTCSLWPSQYDARSVRLSTLPGPDFGSGSAWKLMLLGIL